MTSIHSWRPTVRLALVVASLLVLLAIAAGRSSASTDEGWVITAFDASYAVRADGVVAVTEDIRVDFLGLEKHGIFREIPVEYETDDPKYHRLITISAIKVDDGQRAHKFTTSRNGANLQIKIGDPDRTISGAQRYRIAYEVRGAFNSFDDHDEFYWNVTGNDWPVPIQRVGATAQAPANAVTCYEGPRGSTVPCSWGRATSGDGYRFLATRPLSSGEGLTIVLSTPKGAVAVPPPNLIYIKSVGEQVRDFIGLKPVPIAVAIGLAALAALVILRQWWVAGRDRWFGDVHYLRGGTEETIKPAFAKETVVVEYMPPEMPGKRRLRPAEIGLLLDERADTLDVSATIIDLAVRGYLRITEVEKTWLFGQSDYKLTKLKDADNDLLPYESLLLNSLFEDGGEVDMSDLKNKFYDDLAKVKTALDDQGVTTDRFFPQKPSTVRTIYLVAGLVLAGLGVVAIIGLGSLGAGIVGLPIVLAGIVIAVMSGAMPRRTASGREMFRRCLGFRQYMTVAETDRQRFNEDANIFSEYLPYAIVMGCTEKWAERFKGLGEMQSTPGNWYVGTHAFAPVLFASQINSFSSSISGAISSTPASSGGSGFSGGSSGGGFGGGGGGSW
ncbi:MAG TPA: DUF2207 domain-containing protein [Dehalococcoidia bacterium]|nr:DUF2207 domain-containing protein [Dehalococcoidia bacterium]